MRRYAIILAVLYITSVIAILVVFASIKPVKLDSVAVNDVVMSYQTDTAQNADDMTLVTSLTELFSKMAEEQAHRDIIMRNALITLVTVFAATTALLLLSIDKSILAPFRKLRSFAENVAAGNLDIPLDMDKNASFGAFSESFDLMRVELVRAREAERLVNQSKKELVASLSHDIKTPVASIKAVSELMATTANNAKELEQIETISVKADQIDTLINNLFSATLEELQELPVNPGDFPSTLLYQLIGNSDYRKQARIAEIPECLVIADAIRLAQVFDNIFENSYKYAGTAIDVRAELVGKQLIIEVSDHGSGVAPEELGLLCQKFYRGKNSDGKSGTGLGLYLSRYFVEKMAGELHCLVNNNDNDSGFTVRLVLALA
ncbi:MAG: HAMP domain-containing histidine kinase [Coriobacteriales bacterium]|jgi:signal transduction histidine kinase|nr:HAMP domain-containing histidine kinase [Coriobacteriales bacterium]